MFSYKNRVLIAVALWGHWKLNDVLNKRCLVSLLHIVNTQSIGSFIIEEKTFSVTSMTLLAFLFSNFLDRQGCE